MKKETRETLQEEATRKKVPGADRDTVSLAHLDAAFNIYPEIRVGQVLNCASSL